MELSGQEGEIAIPMNSTSYGGNNGHGHLNIHHDHDCPSPQHNHMMGSSAAPNGSSMQEGYNKKVVVRYRECLKNHAAAMGGNATDGCGEFMPSGDEGTIEALNCSACHCHRNFHRKEVQGDHHHHHYSHLTSKFLLQGHPHHHHHHHHHKTIPPDALGYPTPSRSVPPHQMIMPYSIGPLPSESDEQDAAAAAAAASQPHHHQATVKKRFRTKFTAEQKEKMLSFAEKVGWKIQKQEDSVVQHFCQEIGVKRRVLKVWMHNNKHNLSKKHHNNNNNNNHTNSNNNPPTA